jgi:phosphohistidine phosphatase
VTIQAVSRQDDWVTFDRALVLMRHGKSDWSGNQSDVSRPLAGRGRRQARETGRWLTGRLPGIDLAVVSPATRARDTWNLVADELEQPPPTRVDVRVYDASADDLLEVVHELNDDFRTVLLVGHNPGLEDLADVLTGESVRLPTSSLALIRVQGPWAWVRPRAAVLQASGRPPGEAFPRPDE